MLQTNEVLNFMANSSFGLTATPAKHIFFQFEKNYKMDYSDFVRTLEKLWRIGLLNKYEGTNQATTYLLTFKGKELTKQSGYSREQDSLKSVTNLPGKQGNNASKLLISLIVVITVAFILWFIMK